MNSKKLKLFAGAALGLVLAFSAARAAEPNVLRATLSNGLKVVIVPDKLAPVVTTQINYLTGSNDAPDGFPGTAHALEHMMFRGSTGLDRDQLAQLGTLLGGEYNADTTETVTQYFYEVPASDLGVALKTEALRMAGLSLNQADWDKERGAIEQEVSRDLSSPIYRYLSQLQAIMFAGTPYQHDALGTRPSFDKTQAPLLRGFYERWYAPNNAILVITGDVDPAKALDQVKAAFGDVPRKDLPSHPSFSLTPVKPQTLTLPTNFPVGLATLAFRMPGLRDKNFAAAQILADVLGSQRAALYGMVPAGHALMAEFAYEPKADVGYAVALTAFPKGGDPAPQFAEMRKIFADAAQNGVSEQLVEAAKRQELAQLAYNANSVQGLDDAWSQALAFQGLNSPDDIAKAYRAVTLEDVNRLARELLDPAHVITATLTPQQAGRPVMGAGFGGAENFASAPDKPVPLPDWANAALAQLNLPPALTPPTVTVLPNGLRLIVRPTHVSPTISVFGHIRQVPEIQEPKGKDGLSQITDALFEYGTKSQDRLQLQKSLDDIAAQESAGSDFSLKLQSPQFERGMKLLADNELHPAFPAEAFSVVRQETAQQLAGELQSPEYLFSRALINARVPANDPKRRQATPESIAGLQLADVQQFYHAAFRPDLATIVIVGDITPAQALHVVSQEFGGWKVTGAAPAIDLPGVPDSKISETHVPDPSSLQDSVALTESVALSAQDPDRFVLMLGNSILGGGFSSRLYRDLRVKSGYVYTVSSRLNWSRTRAEYSVSFGSDPQNVGKARAMILQDIKQIQKEPVPDAELNQAKAEMLRQLAMQGDSVDGIAQLYLRETELGVPLDTPQVAAKRFYGATAAELQESFQHWLRPDDLAQVVRGPAEQ